MFSEERHAFLFCYLLTYLYVCRQKSPLRKSNGVLMFFIWKYFRLIVFIRNFVPKKGFGSAIESKLINV